MIRPNAVEAIVGSDEIAGPIFESAPVAAVAPDENAEDIDSRRAANRGGIVPAKSRILPSAAVIAPPSIFGSWIGSNSCTASAKLFRINASASVGGAGTAGIWIAGAVRPESFPACRSSAAMPSTNFGICFVPICARSRIWKMNEGSMPSFASVLESAFTAPSIAARSRLDLPTKPFRAANPLWSPSAFTLKLTNRSPVLATLRAS